MCQPGYIFIAVLLHDLLWFEKVPPVPQISLHVGNVFSHLEYKPKTSGFLSSDVCGNQLPFGEAHPTLLLRSPNLIGDKSFPAWPLVCKSFCSLRSNSPVGFVLIFSALVAHFFTACPETYLQILNSENTSL